MKRINKIISLILVVLSLGVVSLSGCGENGIKPSGEEYVSNYETLYGICETPFELYPEIDPGLTNEWIAHVCKSMGIKSFRVWAHMPMLFTVNDDDSLTLNQEYADRINNFVATIREAGVEKISMLLMERLHLAEDKSFNYASSSIADPTTDYDKYIRTLLLEESAYEIIGREITGVDYYESINEPDHYAGVGVNKNGYVLNFVEAGEYNFTDEETARVCMDLVWYQRRGLKKSGSSAKMMLPALCHFSTTAGFLETCYEVIYSETMPAGQEYADTDPDNYFDALNWHPYVNEAFGVGSYVSEGLWVERQKTIREVAVRYGDAEKPVWMTEFGFSDHENNGGSVVTGTVTIDGQTGLAPVNFIDALQTIKDELPFVEAFCMFRITDMYSVKYDVATENNFGMFYNPNDPENLGKPKPSAVAVARYIKESSGGTFTEEDMITLCKYYYDAKGALPEEYNWWK